MVFPGHTHLIICATFRVCIRRLWKFLRSRPRTKHFVLMKWMYLVSYFYSESRERLKQTIMKVSSKSLNYLSIFFSNSMWIRKLTLNLWKNLNADFMYLHLNLHQWLVYRTSVISTSHVTIQGTCWKWNYLSRFYFQEIMNIDFDEDKRKLPTKSFLKYPRELSIYH